jgi:hypothetical protein
LTNKAYRREPKDTDGLSVASSHELAKLTIERGKGVAAIEINKIPPLNLELVQNDDDHGCIVGIPYREENYNLAMELADKLLELSVVTLDRWNRRGSRDY